MTSYVEILIIGLLGSMHCIGMCGGFVAMYSLKKPASRPAWPYHVLYNLGRITTYTAIGGALGLAGSFATYLGNLRGLPGAVLLFAGVIMVLMGLSISGMLGKRGSFEDAAITNMPLYRRTLHRIMGLDSFLAPYLLGLLLGFLPCGLLYPVFMSAAATGALLPGAVTMAVFGLGTLPALMAFGSLATRITPHLRNFLYRIAAMIIMLLGVQAILRGMAFNGWIPPARFW